MVLLNERRLLIWKLEIVHRSDLLVPGPLVRDSEGKVIGCKGLSII